MGSRTFVVSDVHGHVGELHAALRRAGLTDDAGNWAGADATLWFLGDFFDRGPDGIGVVDTVRRLAAQASSAGRGRVRALLGNHEILALGILLMHADTDEYLHWGRSVDEINAAVQAELASDDIAVCWEIWRRMTTRYAFRGRRGPGVARDLLKRLGGRRIVHGHSVIADLAGVEPAALTGPVLYADGLVLGIDGGVFDEGPCLLVELPPVV